MTLYRSMYPEVESRLRQASDALGQFHGSVVRDLFVEHARGRFAVDDHATKLLRELRAAGEVEPLERAPTVSQRAFYGLQYNSAGYRALDVDDVPEHHYWRWTEAGLARRV